MIKLVNKYLFPIIFLFVNVSPLVDDAFRGMLFIAMAFFLLLENKLKIKINTLALFLLIVTLMLPMWIYDLLLTLHNDFVTGSFLLFMFGITLGFIVSQKKDHVVFLKKFENVVFYTSLVGLLCYLLIFFNPSLLSVMYEYTYGGFTHKTLGVINILYASGEVVWRNSGFASEPGVYQYYVNICYYLSLKSRGFERRSIVYFFLILTTESSVGYIIMIFITFCNIKYLNKKLIVSGFLFMLPMIIYLGIWHYETKIANEIAFEGRIIPTINAINTILSNLLGIGSVKYTIVYDYLDIGSYDSYTQIGMRLGILGIAALILALWRVSKFSYTILGILTLSFLTNPFWFMPAIAMFYFSEKKYAQ